MPSQPRVQSRPRSFRGILADSSSEPTLVDDSSVAPAPDFADLDMGAPHGKLDSAEVERIRGLLSAGARLGAAWAGSPCWSGGPQLPSFDQYAPMVRPGLLAKDSSNIGQDRHKSTRFSPPSRSEGKDWHKDTRQAASQRMAIPSLRAEDLDSHLASGRENTRWQPPVALLKAEDPASDLDAESDWTPRSGGNSFKRIRVYVEGNSEKTKSRIAPCYEVATTSSSSIGAILGAVAPHARAAWPFTLGGSKELWLCLRCRPGGALIPLCRKDKVYSTLAEWADVSAPGWPKLFLTLAERQD